MFETISTILFLAILVEGIKEFLYSIVDRQIDYDVIHPGLDIDINYSPLPPHLEKAQIIKLCIFPKAAYDSTLYIDPNNIGPKEAEHINRIRKFAKYHMTYMLKSSDKLYDELFSQQVK
jgi:hypothetical protein